MKFAIADRIWNKLFTSNIIGIQIVWFEPINIIKKTLKIPNKFLFTFFLIAIGRKTMKISRWNGKLATVK